MANKKQDQVAMVLAAIQKAAGKANTVRRLSAGLQTDIEEVIPTGIEVLDRHVMHIGGLPVGRIIEMYAAEGDGKSSLLHQFCAGAQRAGGVASLWETEHALDSTRPSVFGVDRDALITDQLDTMEEALARIEDNLDALPRSVKGDPAHLVSWDSLASAPTEREVKEGIVGKEAVGDRSRLMSRAMRVLTRKVADKRATLVVVNQTRQKVGGGWGGDGTTTPGGAALKFHASLRLQLFSGKSVKVGDRHVGKQVTIMATKTKLGGPPFAKAKVRLFYATGWNNSWSTVWHAKDVGAVEKSAKYTQEVYEQARAALGWERGFAAGECPDDADVDPGADAELLGEDLDE